MAPYVCFPKSSSLLYSSSISRDLNLPEYDPDYRDLPEYVWNRPSYDEEKRQLLADGWEEAEVDHAVKERNHFREYVRRHIRNRKYYSKCVRFFL